MCSSNGYPYNFENYCGKDQNQTTPLGSHVVNTMLQPITANENHVVFFDNFFTSHWLLGELAGRNIRACGTVRDNRTSKCPLMTNKIIQKKKRGFYDYRSDGIVLYLKWNDNNAVSFANNYYGIVSVHNAERRVKFFWNTTAPQPHLIKMYNLGMGGVDVCDRLLSAYRPRFCSKKWWWKLFSHIVNLTVLTSYKFYNHANPATKVTHIATVSKICGSVSVRAWTWLKVLGWNFFSPCAFLSLWWHQPSPEALYSGKMCHDSCAKRIHASCVKNVRKGFIKLVHLSITPNTPLYHSWSIARENNLLLELSWAHYVLLRMFSLHEMNLYVLPAAINKYETTPFTKAWFHLQPGAWTC